MKKGDRVLTQDSFGRTYIGTVDRIIRSKVYGKTIIEVYVKDSQGNVLPRNKKHVKTLKNVEKRTP